MSRRALIVLLTALLFAALIPQAPAVLGQEASSFTGPAKPIVVQLNNPPAIVVAKAAAAEAGIPFSDSSHAKKVAASQDLFLESVAALGIDYKITESQLQTATGTVVRPHRFALLLNAVALEVPEDAIPAISALTAVSHLEVDTPMKLHLDHSVPYIKASESPGEKTIFSQSGGPAQRFDGTGQVIAVVDSGIDSTHPMFDTRFTDAEFESRTGDTRPVRLAGEPYVEALHHPKVVYGLSIAEGSPATDELGHGTHVASDAAGLKVSAPGPNLIPGDGDDQLAEGSAPGALIMNYKVCGPTGIQACVGVAAAAVVLEDAVSPADLAGNPKPVATVINMSFGDSVGDPNSATATAANNAVLAGAVSVASAGNSADDDTVCPEERFPCENSVGSPAAGRRVVAVGATNDPGTSGAAHEMDALVADDPRYTDGMGASTGAQDDGGRTAVPEDIGMRALHFTGNPVPDFPLGQHYVYSGAGGPGEFPPAVSGRIALVRRGTPFGVVATQAALAGAVAVVIFNNNVAPNDGNAFTGTATSTIPVFGISMAHGEFLRDTLGFRSPTFHKDVPATWGTISNLPLRIGLPQTFESDFNPDTTVFSSRGPVENFQYVKPDVTAPGASIYGAGAGALATPIFVGGEIRYASLNGTSFSGPQAAGAAALLRQAILDFRGEAPIAASHLASGAAVLTQLAQNDVVPPSHVRVALTNTATNLRTADGIPLADGEERSFIHEIGAGLLDVIEAADARVAIGTNDLVGGSGGLEGPDDADSPDFVPSHSFGENPVIGSGLENIGEAITVTMENLTGTSAAGTYQLSIVDGSSPAGDVTAPVVGTTGFSASLSATSVTIGGARDDQATFDVLVNVDGRSAPVGLAVDGTDDNGVEATEFTWWVVATNTSNGETVRMPFYYRAVPGAGPVGPPDPDFEELTLHFHGQPDDHSGASEEQACTGNGGVDIAACEGPFLLESDQLSALPAARWGPVQVALSCNDASGGDCASDPHWKWNLSEPMTIKGPTTIEWWYQCPGCNLALATDFFIQIWADGVQVFEQRIRLESFLPGATEKLVSNLSLPEINAQDSLLLTVDPIFINQDESSILYDSIQGCTPATEGPCDSLVKFNVKPSSTEENLAPVASDDNSSTVQGTPDEINVLWNDSDPNGDSLAIESATQPGRGTTEITSDNTIIYTPDPGFTGIDSFTYTVTDGSLTDTATVTLTVMFADCVTDFSDDLEPEPEQGWAFNNQNGSPNSLTWAHTSDPLAKSATHSFFSDATDASASKDDRLVSPEFELTGVSTLRFWHRFSFEQDFDGGVLEVSTDGGLTFQDIEAVGGKFLQGGYTGMIGDPGRNAWTGNSSVPPTEMEEVVVDLGSLAGASTLVRWRLITDTNLGHPGWWVDDISFSNVRQECDVVFNRPPVAVEDSTTTAEDTQVDIDVLSNDTDPDGDTLSVVSFSDPAHGTVTHNADGTLRYEPDANFNGADSFMYTVSDGNGEQSTAMVRITVTPVNDDPDAVNDQSTTQKNTSVTISVLANDTDPDGDSLTVTAVSEPTRGATATRNADGTITYEPKPGFSGRDTFTYTISDGNGGTDTATVTVTVVRKE